MDDRRQRLVIDLDRLGRVPRLIRGRGDHEGDAVTDAAHLVRDKHRADGAVAWRAAPILGHEQRRKPAKTVCLGIGPGEHAEHPIGRARPCRIDTRDAGVRMRGHDHHAKGLVRQIDVVDEPSAPGYEAPILDAPDRLTDAEPGHSSLPGDRRRIQAETIIASSTIRPLSITTSLSSSNVQLRIGTS